MSIRVHDEPDQEMDLPTNGRPFGVTVISIAFIVNALITGFRVYLSGLDLNSLIDSILLVDIAGPVFAVAGLFIGAGLFLLRRWAWVGAMLWAGLNMAQALIAYYQGVPQFASMALSLVIVFYLNQRDVQLTFLNIRQEVDPDE